jgi:branched-chain amino acid transport system permease protein
MTARLLATRLGLYAAIAAPLLLIAVSDRPFLVQVAIGTAISAILALAWDILSRTGQVSLGHAAFFGIGGYASALLTPTLGAVLAWIAAMLLCGLVAILLGISDFACKYLIPEFGAFFIYGVVIAILLAKPAGFFGVRS